MKKKVSFLLIAVMLLVFLTGCNAKEAQTAQVEETVAKYLCLVGEVTESVDTSIEFAEDVELKFRATNTTYQMQEFGEEFSVYRFDSPNEHVVVYKVASSVYVVGSTDVESSDCYAVIRIPYSEFVALSNNYMLFNTNEGMVAVKINQTKYVLDERLGEPISFDNLSDTERNSFVRPISCEKVTQ